MIIDNFDYCRNFLKFNDKDDYYWIQIICRGKDHPNLPAANKIIKEYYVQSVEEYDKIYMDLKQISDYWKARVYFYPQRRNFTKTIQLSIIKFTQLLYNNELGKPYRVFASAASESIVDKMWIVDIDDTNKTYLQEVINFIDNDCEPLTTKNVLTAMPTLNGYHLICKPFNMQKFRNRFPDIDVHKNNPTILYFKK